MLKSSELMDYQTEYHAKLELAIKHLMSIEPITFSKDEMRNFKMGEIPDGKITIKTLNGKGKLEMDVTFPSVFFISNSDYAMHIGNAINYENLTKHFKRINTVPLINVKFGKKHKYFINKKPSADDVKQQLQIYRKAIQSDLYDITKPVPPPNPITLKNLTQQEIETKERQEEKRQQRIIKWQKDLEKIEAMLEFLYVLRDEEVPKHFSLSNYHKFYMYDTIAMTDEMHHSSVDHIAKTKVNIVILHDDFMKFPAQRQDKKVLEHFEKFEMINTGAKSKVDIFFKGLE